MRRRLRLRCQLLPLLDLRGGDGEGGVIVGDQVLATGGKTGGGERACREVQEKNLD